MQIINDNGELKVKLTKREAKQIVAELEAHLAWFEAVAIPFYAKVFAPSNTACSGLAASGATVSEGYVSASH